jgi:hypothetical protein
MAAATLLIPVYTADSPPGHTADHTRQFDALFKNGLFDSTWSSTFINQVTISKLLNGIIAVDRGPGRSSLAVVPLSAHLSADKLRTCIEYYVRYGNAPLRPEARPQRPGHIQRPDRLKGGTAIGARNH